MVNKQEPIKETEKRIEKATKNKVELLEALSKAMNDLGTKSSCNPLFKVLFNIIELLDRIDEFKFDSVGIVGINEATEQSRCEIKILLKIPLKERNIDLKEFENILYNFVEYELFNSVKSDNN